MNKLKLAGFIILFLLIVIQFFGPARTNPPIDENRTVQALTDIPPNVTAIIDRSCQDCHSNKTTWPWYSSIAPISWLITDDVSEGRKHVNFSDWAQYSPKKITKLLDDICEEVEEGSMPVKIYLWLHPEGKLSKADMNAICNWTKAELKQLDKKTEETDQH